MTTLVLLVACGGSGTMTATGMNSTPQAVATSGTITAFGSVFVNGVRYDVSAARLIKNGVAVTQAGLAVGEVATVRGHEDLQSGQGDANSVEVEDNVVGPIGSIDTGKNQLTALGQTIQVTAATSFGKGISPADITGLKPGDAIEVSGMADANGVITATRIGHAEAGEPLQVLGTVSNLAASTNTFNVNGLMVDFSKAKLGGFMSGQPANGDLVVVRGTQFDAAAVSLKADTVQAATTDPRESEDGTHAETGHVELEGLVTNYVSATDFEVDGAQVTTTPSTEFKGGKAEDLAGTNVRVEVRGMLDANKVLVADTVEIERIAAIELEASTFKVDTPNNTLALLGVTVAVDADTRFEDKSSAAVQMFTLKDVNNGDTVMVRGYESPAGSGKILARRLERLPPSTDAVVRGPFTATTPPQFTILGITIDATNASFGQDWDHGTMALADFFARAVGKIVEVRGVASASLVTATDVRIEGEEDR
jgi:hypothetical protein